MRSSPFYSVILDPWAGEDISKAVRYARKFAQRATIGANIVLQFNGVRLTIDPHVSESDLVKEYYQKQYKQTT